MPVSSVLCHLSCHLVSGHIVFHQFSASQLWSASISLSVYLHLQYLPCGVIFISPLYMAEPSQPLLSEEFHHRVHVCLFPDVYISHMVLSRLSSCPPQHAHFSCVQFPLLLLSNCPTFCTTHHGRFYSRVLYTLSFNFVGMFLSHITPVVSLHFDQAIFTLLFTSFSAPPLASNIEPRYLNVFTVFTSFS